MLWKDENPVMPFNRPLALKRLHSLESKLSKNETFKRLYSHEINEYIRLQYARVLSESEAVTKSDITNYIPHHGVVNSHKPGKIRVVFDAAAKYDGTSLNDNLISGPDLLNNLVAVLHRFRTGKFAAISDVEKMFHQVRVVPSDTDALRFLWRPEENGEVKDFKMLVHLFGKKDSPCIANWALKSCSEETVDPLLKSEIERNFYMDDYLGSFHTPQQLAKTSRELIETLAKRGFNLVKWMSNYPKLFTSLSADKVSPKVLDISNNGLPIERTLGLLWNPNCDKFTFSVKMDGIKPTKRSILSQVSTIFDPLGFLAPAILEPKCIIQELWRRKIDWDETIPSDLEKRWTCWKGELRTLSDITVPRWFGYNPKLHLSPELHVFVDASSKAYGAVAYFRFTTAQQMESVAFVMSKSRLAPLKNSSTTIPRLELQATVIGSRLKVTICKETTFKITSTTFWTDSELC